MSERIEDEQWMTTNPDGSISLDPYAGQTREELKQRCGQLCRELSDWQMTAMIVAEHGRDSLSPEKRDKLEQLIEAYRD